MRRTKYSGPLSENINLRVTREMMDRYRSWSDGPDYLRQQIETRFDEAELEALNKRERELLVQADRIEAELMEIRHLKTHHQSTLEADINKAAEDLLKAKRMGYSDEKNVEWLRARLGGDREKARTALVQAKERHEGVDG